MLCLILDRHTLPIHSMGLHWTPSSHITMGICLPNHGTRHICVLIHPADDSPAHIGSPLAPTSNNDTQNRLRRPQYSPLVTPQGIELHQTDTKLLLQETVAPYSHLPLLPLPPTLCTHSTFTGTEIPPAPALSTHAPATLGPRPDPRRQQTTVTALTIYTQLLHIGAFPSLGHSHRHT